MNGDEAAKAQSRFVPADAACEEEARCCQEVPEAFTFNVGEYQQVPTDCHGGNILSEAQNITAISRNITYGPPRDNHARTAALWQAYLSGLNGRPLDYRDVCWFNVLQKASRDAYYRQRDNLVDACGYLRNIEMAENDEGR